MASAQSSGSTELGHPFASGPSPTGPVRVLRLWLGVTAPVNRSAYAVSGFGLVALKYAVEAFLIWWFTGLLFTPWHFLNPVISIRAEMLQTAPEWLGWALFVWTLPFLWIAVSMSVRRAADAGSSPWLGLLVLAPLLNLIFMLLFCFLPSHDRRHWTPAMLAASGEHAAKSGAFGVGVSLLVGAVTMLVSIYLFSSYGASLFLGMPILMGATASYLYNRTVPRTYLSSSFIGLTAIFFGAIALLLFALEGVICVGMALPLLLPVGAFGGILGKAIAESTRRGTREVVVAALLLPALAGFEAVFNQTHEYEVMTSVTINAPPEVVWRNVVDFPELTARPAWYFRFGIACPQRARIEGQGVDATRYCEFTTGTFVEPVTAWEEPRRLAFNVTDQPAPMFELSPYREIHPPHLDGFLRSSRGEFLLVALPDQQTKLEGRTWYEVKMFPQSYWTLWTHSLLHRIHERVLVHIKTLSESPFDHAEARRSRI